MNLIIKLKNTAAILILIVLTYSCSSSDNTIIVEEEPAMINTSVTTNKVIVTNTEDIKTTADFEISGMTCEIGCAKMIKKTLSDIDGVIVADVSFSEDSITDHAVVVYDPSIVNELEMAAKIQSLSNGQYQVKNIIITKFINP